MDHWREVHERPEEDGQYAVVLYYKNTERAEQAICRYFQGTWSVPTGANVVYWRHLESFFNV